MSLSAQQVSVKLFAADGPLPEVDAVIRAFHAWIQQRKLDELLIDVTDYSHVHDGPGVLLIAHDAQYSVDRGGDRLGLQYRRKRDEPGPLGDKLRDALARAVTAARLLESELGGIRFRGDEAVVEVRNRLLAPNTDDTLAAARGELEAVFASAFDAATDITRVGRAEELFRVRVSAACADAGLGPVAARLAA